MSLTFGDFRKIVAPYAGRAGQSPSSDVTELFAKQVMEYLLLSGSYAGSRRIDIMSCDGIITLPPEVEVPIKVKIDDRPAELWGKWCTFHSIERDFDGYSATDLLAETGVQSPLVHGLPRRGSILGVKAACLECESSIVHITGKDTQGHEIYTYYKGERIPGEKFSLVKGVIQYGGVVFGEVTGVVKPQTNGYVACYAVNPTLNRVTRYLGEWSPAEERPMYRRYRLRTRGESGNVRVSMLCRVKIKDKYHDNELTFFDNSLAVMMAAQRLQAEVNNDPQLANYKRQALEDTLDKEAGYKKVSGNVVDVYRGTSGGAIKNIVR